MPPLSEPEAETYLNILFAQLRLSDADFDRLRETAHAPPRRWPVRRGHELRDRQGRRNRQLRSLEADFAIAARIAPTLSRGLRGNPRQLKRFLNTLLLRLETAKRRGATLDPAILARLMVLEVVAPKEFQQLFDWQLAQDGVPEELAAAESAARAGKELPEGSSSELTAWFGAKAVQGWLKLDPELEDVAPRPVLLLQPRPTVAVGARGPAVREAPSVAWSTSVTGTAQRRPAVDAAAALAPEEYTLVYDALLDRAKRRPESPAMASMLELTAKVPASWPTLTAGLRMCPTATFRIALPLVCSPSVRDEPEVEALLDQWAASAERAAADGGSQQPERPPAEVGTSANNTGRDRRRLDNLQAQCDLRSLNTAGRRGLAKTLGGFVAAMGGAAAATAAAAAGTQTGQSLGVFPGSLNRAARVWSAVSKPSAWSRWSARIASLS